MMKELIVSDEIFLLYKEGLQAFIQILRTDEQAATLKKTVSFGESVFLKNKRTQELLEQKLWFILDYPLNDLYILVAFACNPSHTIFSKRRDMAIFFQGKSADIISFEAMSSQLPDFQKGSHQLLIDHATFFFVGGAGLPGDKLCFIEDMKEHKKYFIILDVLKLPTKKENVFFEVRSVFPLDLLGP
jgi:hypothetical protein